ncbi:MAG: DUF1800 domain-containing protein [Pleurocapsa sp. SU_5_0]|nr:DUF1800 domain-containing protein [Pleurocapsa sp. SU_5_0]
MSELLNQKHILSKLSFGATSAELKQVAKTGIEAYIQFQLEPQSINESSRLENYLSQLDLINRNPIELNQKATALRKKLQNSQLSSEQQQEIQQDSRKLAIEMVNQAEDAHLLRAIYSNRQLQEVMVDFWFNHFNVYAQKDAVKFWLYEYENQIRAHALGSFYDLLLATAKHPAMLMYLDNQMNTAPDSPAGKKHNRGLNENYARELMELHTLGVDGGYSQDDVITLARIFTGWSTDRSGKKGEQQGFFFFASRHDRQNKVFLGQQISASGIEEGEVALKILANHPATAHHISYELAQYFVADLPPESLVNHLAKIFLDSQGNIQLVMDALIHSQEFNDPQYFGQKFKTPYQYLISLVRWGEIQQPNLKRLRGMLFQLSMPTYGCIAPDGYSNAQSVWLNPQAMLQRTGLATAIANGVLNKNSLVEIQQLEQNLGVVSQRTKQVIEQTPVKLRTALMMGSPEAMYR